MTQKNKDHGPRTERYAIGTAVYVLIIAVGAWLLGFFDPKGIPIDPSEWGDVLAGVFSPLAFLWLLYAALSQRAELELQREELRQNNETQQQQQVEMSRQADALLAQIKRVEAQANATYEPIFVLKEVNGNAESDSFVFLTIENVGGTALNVHSSSCLIPQRLMVGKALPGSSIGPRSIPYWPADTKVQFMLSFDAGVDREEPHFSFGFRRLDVVSGSHKYALTDNARRIELREASYEEVFVRE